MTFTPETAIRELQKEHCTKCRVGCAIMALDKLRGDDDPGPVKSVETTEETEPNDPPVIPDPVTEKVCKRCGETKPIEAFEKNKLTKDGRLGTCRECRNATSRKKYRKISGEKCRKCGKTFKTRQEVLDHISSGECPRKM